MEFFRKFFEDVDLTVRGEVKVSCPFHNDHRPSASVNTDSGLFYCHVCQWGGNEETFYAKLHPELNPRTITKLFATSHSGLQEWKANYQDMLWADEDFLTQVRALGLSNPTIEETRLGLILYKGEKFLGVPVFFDKMLVDVRRYNLLKHPGLPKMIGNEGVHNGHVVPYDLWNKEDITYIFEGEKDMLLAREYGLNAITLTGGAGAVPNDLTLPAFKDTEIILCYDNDKAGRDGMVHMYRSLKDIAKSVKYIDIATFVPQDKGDFADFIRGNGDIFDFLSATVQDFIDNEEAEKVKMTPIFEALRHNLLLRRLTSEVTVASEYATPYVVPSTVKFRKMEEPTGKYDAMEKDDELVWMLDDSNFEQSLELIEVDAKKVNVDSTLRKFLNIHPKEENLAVSKADYLTIYRCSVVDKRFDGVATPLELYSVVKMQVGGQYVVDYTLYNHPTKNQQLVGVAHSVVALDDNSNYHPNIDLLSVFRKQGTIEERLKYLYQSAKHHIAKHLDYKIWLMTDLVFNSILEIPYGEPMSGALDVFFLGDTQVGKSETTSRMVELYNFGKFLSLKTSSTVGLIGGSTSVNGSWCNTIGAIPRQHKRLVVLEEFSGAKADFIKTMTDIRTSKTLRLARAAGELEVPCHLRMISISNPINAEDGTPRFLSTFPTGVQPIMELITSAEDVGRYDAFLLIPKVEVRKNPFGMTLEGKPIPKTNYEHKSEWVTTRTIDDVKYEEGVEGYIWEKGEKLNAMFECNFPVFGTTTSKKLARFCVAMASLLMNTDEEYQQVIVTKEIVDYVVNFLIEIYTMDCFRLDAYKEEYDRYNTFNKADAEILEKLYPQNTVLLDFIFKHSRTSRNNLQTVSGLDRDKFGPVFNQLVSCHFIRMEMDVIYPTEKYRKTYPKISKRSTSTGAKLIDSINATQGKEA